MPKSQFCLYTRLQGAVLLDQGGGAGQDGVALRAGGMGSASNMVSVGSKDAMGGPNCVTMPPPELTPCPAAPTAPMLVTVTPVRLTLVGPAATPDADTSQRAARARAPQHFLR